VVRKPSMDAPKSAHLTPDDMRRGKRRLEKRLAEVTEFDPKTLDQNDPWATVRPLSTSVETALDETFGKGSIEYNRYFPASKFDWPLILGGDVAYHDKVKHVAEDRNRSIQLLQAAIRLLDERIEEAADLSGGERLQKAVFDGNRSNKIFIVHGHDNGTKESVARFVTRLGYEPIILHEQANKGRTIIEKFRDEADSIGFAIVLMSPDDELVSGMKRARQNVILELGFFLGRLGPSNVAALVRGDVETPSDFDGVIYTKVDDSGIWKVLLAKELKAAGYLIDLNKAL